MKISQYAILAINIIIFQIIEIIFIIQSIKIFNILYNIKYGGVYTYILNMTKQCIKNKDIDMYMNIMRNILKIMIIVYYISSKTYLLFQLLIKY